MRDFHVDIRFFFSRLFLRDENGGFTKKMFDGLPDDVNLLSFKQTDPVIDVCRYYRDPEAGNGNLRDWRIRSQNLLVEFRLLYVFKQAI